MNKDQSGFTLIELIVTIAVTGLILGGIVNVYIGIQAMQRKTYHLELATRAGERQVESLRNSHYASLEPGVPIDFSSELPDDLANPKTGVVEVSEPSDGLRRVDITITYKDGSRTQTVKQSSLIGVIGIAQ